MAMRKIASGGAKRLWAFRLRFSNEQIETAGDPSHLI
jgi:hypothetical protein